MERVTIYHNPACSKSRAALEILQARAIAHDTIEYLQAPPDRNVLAGILDRLPGAPGELVRKDTRFKALGLDAARYQSRDEVIALLLAHPELMERPVVIRGSRAVIARPPEKVLELLER